MLEFREAITVIIRDYATESAIYVMMIFGFTFMMLGLFWPKDLGIAKIDLKRLLQKDNITTSMSEKNKYYHTLARTGFFKAFMLKEESDDYKKQTTLIRRAGGLDGMTPDVLNLYSYLILFGVIGVAFVALFLIEVFGMEVNKIQVLIGFVLAGAIGFISPEFWVKKKIKKRKIALLDELDTIQLFTVIYLRAGYGVYDLIEALTEVTNYTRIMFNELRNEYYINTEKSLQNLADKIELEEYQLLMDILKQAVNISGNEMVNFVEGHMRQMKKTKELAKSASNKKKPLTYTFLLALPLVSIIILWFYPLFLDVMKTFNEMGI